MQDFVLFIVNLFKKWKKSCYFLEDWLHHAAVSVWKAMLYEHYYLIAYLTDNVA